MGRWLRGGILAVVTGAVVWLLEFTPGPLPPLGPFLDPVAGFWANGASVDRLPERLTIPGLREPVRVFWDERRVPHVFARNAHDLYLAQGYVTARDRLWQMDFQTRASAGRLSEVLGKKALAWDRYRRRLGFNLAAENAVRALEEDPETREAAGAYAAGVNAWIDGLDHGTLPIEFKLLDYEPEPWTPLHSALLFKYMAWDLTGRSDEVAATKARELLGSATFDRLYPVPGPYLDPVIPEGTPWDFTPVAVPPPPPAEVVEVGPAGAPPADAEEGLGSNNWAVSGGRTASGRPILAADPHLGLNLPSIWYEIQLVSPEGNTYGVSLPGAPSIVIGFNEHVAWGATNAETDVLDWYEIEFRDETRAEYRFGEEWRPTEVRTETIRVRGGADVEERVLLTHLGPVVTPPDEAPPNRGVPPGAALRWTGHDPSNELAAFLSLNRALGYDDFVAALSRFDCPAQNFAFASAAGDIAIWHDGKLPLRWEGQGRTVSPGDDPAYEWAGWIPRPQLPHVLNPPRGFVSSANQTPVALDYPYFLAGNYASFGRGARINEELARLADVTPQDMMDLQLDVLDVRARMVVPALLAALEGEELSDEERRGVELLGAWDDRFAADRQAPVLFDAWWSELSRTLWTDLMGAADRGLELPARDVTIHRVLHPDAWGAKDDEGYERGKIRAAFHAAFADVVRRHGPPGPGWAWGAARPVEIRHLTRTAAFSRLNLAASGRGGVINATGERFGPSWRMVVALGPEPRAWGIFPGGESGNPGSPGYDAFIDDWLAGKMYELAYLRSAADAETRSLPATLLDPEARR